MITLTLPTKRPPSVSSVYHTGSYSTPNLLPLDEFHRRQKIITDLVSACTYKAQHLVYPVDEKSKNREGMWRIMAIAGNWMDYKGSETNENKVEWPKNDNPKLVHAYCYKDDKTYSCTTNYFRSLTQEELKEFLDKEAKKKDKLHE